MDVFISWSGPQSKQVAEALRHHLPLMIQAIKPWLSSADIEAGARWAIDIADNLQKSKVGVLCLTPANLNAPWVHFEAGALAKTLDHTFVCPYLTDLKETDLKGPLTQFQMKQSDKEGTRALLETLNRALKENALQPDALTAAFDMCWPKLNEKLQAITQEQPAPKKRAIEDMLEELLELARRQARLILPETQSTAAAYYKSAQGNLRDFFASLEASTKDLSEAELNRVWRKLFIEASRRKKPDQEQS